MRGTHGEKGQPNFPWPACQREHCGLQFKRATNENGPGLEKRSYAIDSERKENPSHFSLVWRIEKECVCVRRVCINHLSGDEKGRVWTILLVEKCGKKDEKLVKISNFPPQASTLDFRWVFHSREEENPGKPRVSVCSCSKKKSSNQRRCVCVCVRSNHP